MDKFLGSFLKKTRKIIIDSVNITEDRIEFNTAKALAKGHLDTDVAVADELLVKHSHFTDKFLEQVQYVFGDSEFNSRDNDFKPLLYYVPAVKIIFIINVHDNISTVIYEEELIKEVAIREALEKYLDFNKPYEECFSKGTLVQRKWD